MTRGRLRRWVYRSFYALPPFVRRRLIRAAMGKYVVGAVALVHDSAAPPPGRLLLLRQPSGVGWSLPAGLLRRGERPVDGCARELTEETGLVVAAEALAPATPNAIVHSGGRWIDVVFEARVTAAEHPLVVDGAEVLDAAYHRLDNLPPLTPSTARLLSYYGIGPYVAYPEVRP